MLTKKVFVTAECSKSSKEARSKFYTNLENNGFEVDIRGTKKKKVFCPSGQKIMNMTMSTCKYSKQGFEISVQSEVDVAIVMKVMSSAF